MAKKVILKPALDGGAQLALDPFPYNGATTTCEALWMGVPVVTLRGDRHAGRVGASLLTQADLTDWTAGSIEDYLEIAVTLVGDRAQLKICAVRCGLAWRYRRYATAAPSPARSSYLSHHVATFVRKNR